MNRRIINTAVPYIDRIDRGNFYPGKDIRITGFIRITANRFYINLQCEAETTSQNEVALQMAVYASDGYISLNSLKNEVWGEEHRIELPIKQSKTFEVILTCDVDQYKVTIDGRHYYEFPQRIHYNRITHLAIDGNVSIFQINYESASRGDTREPSLIRMRDILQPHASVSLRENHRSDFQILFSADPAPNLEIQPRPLADSSAPPSYEVALDTSYKAPYPTSDPVGMPCPTGVPRGKDFLPYPPAAQPGIFPPPSYRIGVHPLLAGPLVIPPPLHDTPVNGDASIFQIFYETDSISETGGLSGSRLAETLRPSAQSSSAENDEDEFEVTTSAATAASLAIHPPSFADSSALPSYEAALDASKKAPYPTSDPIGMPYLLGAAGDTDFLIYPPASATGTLPLLPDKIGIHLPGISIGTQLSASSIGTHLPASPPVIVPPPGDAPVPVNMGSSNNQADVQSRSLSQRLCVVGIILGFIAIFAVVVTLENHRR